MTTRRPYSIVAYDPQWPDRFRRQSVKIKAAMGEMALAVHHVGSTSVPGMVAKSNIDIVVVVPNLEAARSRKDAMAKAGFVSRGDYSHIGEEYFTEDAANGERLTSIHVFPEGSPEIQTKLVFRDYLRTHANERHLYIQTKQRLYDAHANDYAAYDSGKQEVIEGIKKRAREWADAHDN